MKMDQNGHAALSDKLESLAIFKTRQGVLIQANVTRLSRHAIVFELPDPTCDLQASEVLNQFEIKLNDQAIYSGQAVITSVVNTGMGLVCEVALQDKNLDLTGLHTFAEPHEIKTAFDGFLQNWGKSYKILPEFKVLLADMTSFLHDLRLWLEQIELGFASLPPGRAPDECEVVRQLMVSASPAFHTLFGRFEEISRGIEEDLQPAHRAFCRMQLHPLLLCSPFMNRIYSKPLGYAGDYEMVNMILRDPFEGETIYAKLLNAFILAQAPAVAHRNRVAFLTQKLVEETNRLVQAGRTARVFNIGCGPAGELQAFLRDHHLSDRVHATLLDSNDETLESTQRILKGLKQQHHRQTRLEFVKQSVHHLLKQTAKTKTSGAQFDFIYCAGLFDYLNDRACQALMELFYHQLAPGGLLVATNVDSYNPIRNIMEYIYEWHLIYRSGAEFAKLAPKQAAAEETRITADSTSSNIFIEVRKPLSKS
jgi:extracellular factor (EF) 3-hydroxypalmitic acid methyl ester biosynthesis protein